MARVRARGQGPRRLVSGVTGRCGAAGKRYDRGIALGRGRIKLQHRRAELGRSRRVGAVMELTGWWGAAGLAAPLAVLVAVMAFHARTGRRRGPQIVPPEIATGRYGTPVLDRRPPMRPVAAPVRPPKPLVSAMPLEELLTAIAAAERSGDEKRLAALYVGLARQHVSTGRTDEAAGVLRQSIRIASRLGLAAEHAAARLELGDIALAGGDLTTACEHWQIARGLYFELKAAHELEAAETRMQRTGCPTDWVLNDF